MKKQSTIKLAGRPTMCLYEIPHFTVDEEKNTLEMQRRMLRRVAAITLATVRLYGVPHFGLDGSNRFVKPMNWLRIFKNFCRQWKALGYFMTKVSISIVGSELQKPDRKPQSLSVQLFIVSSSGSISPAGPAY